MRYDMMGKKCATSRSDDVCKALLSNISYTISVLDTTETGNFRVKPRELQLNRNRRQNVCVPYIILYDISVFCLLGILMNVSLPFVPFFHTNRVYTIDNMCMCVWTYERNAAVMDLYDIIRRLCLTLVSDPSFLVNSPPLVPHMWVSSVSLYCIR